MQWAAQSDKVCFESKPLHANVFPRSVVKFLQMGQTFWPILYMRKTSF